VATLSTAQSEQGGARVRFPPPLVFLGFILAGVVLQYFVTPLQAHLAAALRLAVACLLVLGGLALFVPAMRWFKRTGQHPRPWTPSPSLILEGPYRFSRNPIYVAMTAVQAGIGVALDNIWMLCFSVPALVVIHYIAVRPEEAYLVEKFGEAYEKYRSAVRRYI
jgi:protein-S-isoprenylcysteine O-methyltransferase Ste14